MAVFMKANPAPVSLLLLLSLLLTSCSTPAQGFWVPPPLEATIPPYLVNTPLPTMEQITITNPLPTSTDDLDEPTPQPEATSSVPDASPTPTPPQVNTTPYLYYAQAADSLRVVAIRFGVQVVDITIPPPGPQPLSENEFLTPGQLLLIPRQLGNTTSSQRLMPDSEVVFSPSAADFDTRRYAAEQGGYIHTYKDWLKSTGATNGAGVVHRVALENSVNPRLLLALLEYHSGWVTGQPRTEQSKTYPFAHVANMDKGLYNQTVWAVNQLSIGYYAYREGRLTEIRFPNGMTARLAPDLNAGTAALQYYFAQHYQGQDWVDALDPDTGFPALYAQMFGDPWERAQRVEPLFPPGITQPPLTLPFTRGWVWAYTGGPHGAWEYDGAYAALDFAPGSVETGCVKSTAYVTAAAPGLVVRSGNGVVVLDLDGDGSEHTGWVLIYLHVSSTERIPNGSWVNVGDNLGHPSCEGGLSTGTHLHIARKFNGEWIPADGPLPFDLGGWVAQAGAGAYKGTMTRDGVTITANVNGAFSSRIFRGPNDP
jgi:LasA protease